MAVDAPQLLAKLASLPPAEAVVYMQQRGLLTETFSWMDLWQEEHTTQFTVSRLVRTDLLQAMHDGVTASVKGDMGRRDFMRGIKDTLVAEGWWGEKQVTDPKTGELLTTRFDSARLKLIYDTNTRMSYSAGLWQRIERNKATSPYIRYITKRDERVRVSHRALDNVTLPVDDPFWDTHFPPNGWRCRCRAMSMSQAEYDKGLAPDGRKLNKTAPEVELVEWKNKRTGETGMIPKGIDPGFGYNPGKAPQRAENLNSLATQKLDVAAEPIAAAAVKDLVKSEAFTSFYAEPGGLFPIAVLPALDAAGIGARTHTVRISADTMLKQIETHPELASEEYSYVQEAVERGTKIQDTGSSLIYLLEADGYVTVVKATKTGKAVFMTSLRRLSSDEVKRDEEIKRLMKKGGN